MSEMPDLTSRVIGFRSWLLMPDGQLHSRNPLLGAWEPGDSRAECRRDRVAVYRIVSHQGGAQSMETIHEPAHVGEVPGHDCTCGFYAYHGTGVPGFGSVVAVSHYPTRFAGAALVRGAVAAWGRMEAHADGFRAEYARPVAFVRPVRPAHLPAPETDDRLRRAAARFGVECVPLDELALYALSFGDPIPASLYPQPGQVWSGT